MFDFLKWLAAGKQIYDVVTKIVEGKSAEGTIPISVKGRKYVLTLRLDPVSGSIQPSIMRIN